MIKTFPLFSLVPRQSNYWTLLDLKSCLYYYSNSLTEISKPLSFWQLLVNISWKVVFSISLFNSKLDQVWGPELLDLWNLPNSHIFVVQCPNWKHKVHPEFLKQNLLLEPIENVDDEISSSIFYMEEDRAWIQLSEADRVHTSNELSSRVLLGWYCVSPFQCWKTSKIFNYSLVIKISVYKHPKWSWWTSENSSFLVDK